MENWTNDFLMDTGIFVFPLVGMDWGRRLVLVWPMITEEFSTGLCFYVLESLDSHLTLFRSTLILFLWDRLTFLMN